jgi:hypothetical protein
MSDIGIGRLITTNQKRDAIHVAVAPVISFETLQPGQRIGLTGENVVSAKAAKTSGIVDPFLTAPVQPRERFWMFLDPGSIKSLRHEWAHPDFSMTEAQARAVVVEIAAELHIPVEQLMGAAQRWLDSESYEVQRGAESWRDEFPEHAERFWEAWEAIYHVKVEEKKATFFSCSC